jgi:hypothetical protein
MALMERLALARRGGFVVGMAMAVVVALAVFGFGAPPLILIPVGFVGSTAYMQLRLRAMRNVSHRR